MLKTEALLMKKKNAISRSRIGQVVEKSFSLVVVITQVAGRFILIAQVSNDLLEEQRVRGPP